MDGNASCFILNLKVAIQLKFPKIVLIETMGWAFFSFFHVLSLTGSLLKKSCHRECSAAMSTDCFPGPGLHGTENLLLAFFHVNYAGFVVSSSYWMDGWYLCQQACIGCFPFKTCKM